jgi:pyruvate,orthophosphate dikinase
MTPSTALQRNLEETTVKEIYVEPRYNILKEAVKDYQGISRSAEQLINELHHPYINWTAVTEDLKSFSTKHLSVIKGSPLAVPSIEIILDSFFKIIHSAPKEKNKCLATNHLFAFLEKAIKSLPEHLLKDLLPKLAATIDDLAKLDDHVLLEAVMGYHPFSGIILSLDKNADILENLPEFLEASTRLLIRMQELSLKCWLRQEDPLAWLDRTVEAHDLSYPQEAIMDVRELLKPVSHVALNARLDEVKTFYHLKADRNNLIKLAGMPGFLDVVRDYKEITKKISRHPCIKEKNEAQCKHETLFLFFLFHLMEIDTLGPIHEETLRRINRTLIKFIQTGEFKQLQKFLPKTFSLLKDQVGHYPSTALQCIDALGKEVFRRDMDRLTELFLEQVVDFGFQPPGIKGVDAEWQILCNPSHLQNIRSWLNIVKNKPKACGTLMSALLINLKFAGTCIKDTDIFQKDITQLLNCEIGPIYNIIKQFSKILPIYFNEIGAEGLLRDVSTEIDEIHNRKDILIHFLRKQSHVESNNLIVDFIEAILCFWYNGEKKALRPYLPPEAFNQISNQGIYVDHMKRLLHHLASALGFEPFAAHIRHLLHVKDERITEILSQVTDTPPQEKKRLELLIQMYRLETLKYRLNAQEITHYIKEAKAWSEENLDAILKAIEVKDPEKRLELLLDQLEELKKVILSDKEYEIRESIYHKRHIAVDIPSMYGRYHERKFDALALSLRLESLAAVTIEQLVNDFNLQFITKAIFSRIVRYLKLFWRGIQIEGVSSTLFLTYLDLLEQSLKTTGFNFSQYIDIVRGLSEGVKDMINVYYISPHSKNISQIIDQLGRENLLPKYQHAFSEAEGISHLKSLLTESVLRDLIAATFCLQHLDNFISKIYQVLHDQKAALNQEDLNLMLSYDPDRIICPIDSSSSDTKNLIYLGNKGFQLLLLVKEGINVPPGTIITTEAFRCNSIIQKFPGVYRNFRHQAKKCVRKIEKAKGRSLGDPNNPLLLSVRSGSVISMPGMMSTIINVGCNIEITEGLSKKTGKIWFAWDNYRRFLQSWAMSFGLAREAFSELMKRNKRLYGVSKKREFTGKQMKELALLYRDHILEKGIYIEDDPFEQLIIAIRMVIGSWDSSKAKAYREIMDISHHWGTAVILQAMAFGNLSESSGTGVVFTANPKGKLDRVSLWGDFTPGNQGEDIVSGLVSTYPISTEQKEILSLDTEMSLEENFPGIYQALLDKAKHLVYEKKWSPQEIEFTFEGPKPEQLYILQTRNMHIKEKKDLNTFVPGPDLDKDFIGRGIGVSGGAITGTAVFSLKEIEKYRDKNPEMPLILIRRDTVPDDIKEISLSDGLLTSRGGQTSHASIVALRLDKTCIVGCKQLHVLESKGIAEVDSRVIKSGDYISIDGKKGTVYQNRHPVQDESKLFINKTV